ncbi:major facilitator superfamily domain-containing protein [Aspergillus ambiguus]|uniref:major facilitator superfamily domain-containing protein n=1 Tax=Aspergillus ambiguus TaxID=176160 RepID=UPI003CCDBFC0
MATIKGPSTSSSVADADGWSGRSERRDVNVKNPIPLHFKVVAIFFISCIGFSWHWSSGVTKALKSTIKDEMNISNTQFSLLEASDDFMSTILVIPSGLITDRIGGVVMVVYGKLIYTLGSMLVAAATTVRSYDFMVTGRIILSIGHISTQIAQYKMFSAWFSPGNGFAMTLGFEAAASKVGGFVGRATANIISQDCGFVWAFWVAVFINLTGNAATILFWLLDRYCDRHYDPPKDEATGDNLRRSNKKFKLTKILQLPWMYWVIMAYAVFESTTTSVFSQNSTELTEKLFHLDPISAGWYSAVAQYGGFFLAPLMGYCLDHYGKRVFALFFSASCLLFGMVLLNYAESKTGLVFSFVAYGVVKCTSSVILMDSIRTIMWEEAVFGTASAIKSTIDNAMSIVVRLITGVLQDQDNGSYVRVNYVYLILAICLVVIATSILLTTLLDSRNFAPLQWAQKKRFKDGPGLLAELRDHHFVQKRRRTRFISLSGFTLILLLTVASWGVYIWGAVTGNEY